MSKKLRSANWFGRRDINGFLHRAWVKTEGFSSELFDGRPVIGIGNSWSEFTNCNVHLRAVAEAVKRGVWQAGGFPLEFPTISLGENLMKPTTMLFRNLMAMDIEESISGYPMDGVVLLAGCDKTVPAGLMGAASCNLPTLMITGGPMLNGHWKGRDIGVSDCWRFFEELRSGQLTEEEINEIENCVTRSAGHCMVMGTASTMASMVEALGMTLPGASAIPAADSRRYQMAEAAGRRIVEMVRSDLKPSDILTPQAFENAIRVLHAISGSTNAVIHLIAIAGRAGFSLPLQLFDELSRSTPWLTNLKPAGQYMMEDFYYAGGLPALMAEIRDLLHLGCITVTGKTVGENIKNATIVNETVIARRNAAFSNDGGLAILRGNLCPDGAVIKKTAATKSLLSHEGPAVVFESHEQMQQQLDDPTLNIDENSVLVLKNAGPKGAPGMPEWGHLPIPTRLLSRGIKDIVRISDARMSGTAYGTVVLHISPESAIGGPLAVVQTNDPIRLDVDNRELTLKVEDREIQRRLASWTPGRPRYQRGYKSMFIKHVMQANLGCDFDFLQGNSQVDSEARTYD